MYFRRMKTAFLNLSLTSKLKYIYTALIFLCISCNLLILYGFFPEKCQKQSPHLLPRWWRPYPKMWTVPSQ